MSYQINDTVFDLRLLEQEGQPPTTRFVAAILRQIVLDSADRVEFSLTDSLPEATFHISGSMKGRKFEMQPPPCHLFEPVVVVLCNHASVPYYAKGTVEGKIETTNPASSWLLRSEDLRKYVVLSKT
jgi:hypothetical protein